MGACLSFLSATPSTHKNDEFTSLQQLASDSASFDTEVIDTGKPVADRSLRQQQQQQQAGKGKPPASAAQPLAKRSAADFIIEQVSHATIIRGSGSIGGEAFAMDQVTDSHIYLLDHLATVTVDRIERSHIIIGPTEGSVFLRDCSDSVLIIAASQVRLRDCHRCRLYLYCSASQPVIESSTQIAFNGFPISYTGLQQQLTAAGLHPFNTQYDNVHDFTTAAGKQHWSYDNRVQQPFTRNAYSTIIAGMLEKVEAYNEQHADAPVELSTDGSTVIPYAIGMRNSKASNARSCLLLVAECSSDNTSSIPYTLLSRLSESLCDAEQSPQLRRSKQQAVSKQQMNSLHGELSQQLQSLSPKQSFGSLICMECEYYSDAQLEAVSLAVQQLDTESQPSARVTLIASNVHEVASHHFALQRM